MLHAVMIEEFLAVIAGEYDQGLIVELEILEALDQLTNAPVQVSHLPCIKILDPSPLLQGGHPGPRPDVFIHILQLGHEPVGQVP